MSNDARTLYLCNTHGQLLFAICDALLENRPTSLVYLEDEVPLSPGARERLQHQLPELALHITRDGDLMREFANLPRPLPAILRRNLRAFASPRNWQPKWLRGKRYDQAFIHNTGFFAAKMVAGISDRVILREGGFNNYNSRPVHGLKRLLRRLSGYPSTLQSMGEERWVDEIAVARPEELPIHLRAKGSGYDLQQRLARLSDAQRRALVACLGPELPELPAEQRNALLLTQPLDLIGMCDRPTKEGLYIELARQLAAAGYRVFLKNHPRETPFELPDTIALDPVSPIELWPLLGRRPFDIAVALCSASLANDTRKLCDQAIQLVSPDSFHPEQFEIWHSEIDRRLVSALVP